MKYSEEEKKAIEDLRKTIDYYNKRFNENEKITSVLIDNFDVKNLFVLLNLVGKQQKEIEEQKSRNKKLNALILDLNKALEDSISKEAIKEKIEELEKDNKYYMYGESGIKYQLLKELLGE